MNEIGARCLPYSEKGSRISEIMVWFAEEIQTLPDAIGKANKNFFVYCLVSVLKMLQEHARCSHVAGPETFMTACDGSIIDEVPADVTKIAAHIVKKWWSSYGLPYFTELFCVEPEVRFNCPEAFLWFVTFFYSHSFIILWFGVRGR
jgi:hypothetical protein